MKSFSEKKKTINWQQRENTVTTTDNSVFSVGRHVFIGKKIPEYFILVHIVE